MKKKVHFTNNYLLNPTHPITAIVIGCGGTGSQVLSSLARMNQALRGLGSPGLHVIAIDDDIVSESNIGRQLFSEADIDMNKAVVLVTRLNRFFGTSWEALPNRYTNQSANIIISCVDNKKTREDIDKQVKELRKKYHYNPYVTPYYWLDFGNTTDTGQVVLGTINKEKQPKSRKFKTVAELPCITEKYDFSQINEEESGPSCSLAEALGKQDLFINSSLAQLGCNILWKMLRLGYIEHVGLFLNLRTMKVNPITL